MSISLREIPGVLPYTEVDALARYAQERGYDATSTAAGDHGLPISDSILREVVKALNPEAAELRQRTEYLGPLALSFHSKLERQGEIFAAANGLRETSLTTLFAESYGADFTEITALGLYRIFGVVLRGRDEGTINLNYQITQPEPPRTTTFWQLWLDHRHGSVNFWPVGEHSPVSGVGNIALVAGVDEALTKDLSRLR